jgi:hypothetical protein
MRRWTLLHLLFLWPVVTGWSAPSRGHNPGARRSPKREWRCESLRSHLQATFLERCRHRSSRRRTALPCLPVRLPLLRPSKGTLTLSDPAASGSARILRDDFGDDSASNSPWRHLPGFSFQFVQNGSYLSSRSARSCHHWESGMELHRRARTSVAGKDRQRLHARFASLRLDREKSELRPQRGNDIPVQPHKEPQHFEGSLPGHAGDVLVFQADMWGQLAATYAPGSVANDRGWKNAEAAEVANRMPTKPFSALAKDYPNSGIDL